MALNVIMLTRGCWLALNNREKVLGLDRLMPPALGINGIRRLYNKYC